MEIRNFPTEIKNFILDIFFPKFCLGCGKEGEYFCQDCLSLIEILEYQFCPGCQKKVIEGRICQTCKKFLKLNGLYFAASYQNQFVKKMISQFKYEPFVKELANPLAFLIITHFLTLGKVQLIKNSQFLLIPIPLDQKRLRWRGFNQAEELAKELSNVLEIPLINDVLFKIKKTSPQIELTAEARKENIKEVFLVKNSKKIKSRKILLVDDIYTTGSTMNEAARILKESGAKEVWGVTIARE